jgi:hypothetical protein
MSGLALAAAVAVLGACADSPSAPSAAPAPAPPSDGGIGGQPGSPTTPTAGTIRLRCQLSAGRSKISVDGSGLTPRSGSFQARVTSVGGTVTASFRSALGDEAEFDFDSNPNDIAAGATPIPATFAGAVEGPDVVAEILNPNGEAVAKGSGECTSL